MRDLRDAIRRYLRDRPDAADTVVGIQQWWLPESLRGVSTEQLRGALVELMASHEVRCTTLPDGSELYSRAAGPMAADEHGCDEE